MTPTEDPPSAPSILGPLIATTPLIICFHGSGDSCASWTPLARILSTTHRVLLYDRGPAASPSEPAVAIVRRMRAYLRRAGLAPPYVLVAHSYGGLFARLFLEDEVEAEERRRWAHRWNPLAWLFRWRGGGVAGVAGVVLAETGQETALPPRVEERQYRRQILGDRPLSVIRCDTLLWKRTQLQKEGEEASTEEQRARVEAQRVLLDLADQTDEQLKKRQLLLSRNSRYVHVPDCGHNVIQDRPKVVAEEVRWVLDNVMERNTGTDWPQT